MPKTDYSKLRTKVLGIIEGLALADPDYNELRRLLTFCEGIHKNTRKDGSREFSHQLEMIAFAITFHNQLTDPLSVYCAILVHDVLEDYPEQRGAMLAEFPSVVDLSTRLSKWKDSSHDEDKYYGYFASLADCPVCSIVKLIDRVHNLSTAPGVFSVLKLREYIKETENYYFGLIRECKLRYENRNVYENLKFILTTQVNTIQALLPAPEPYGSGSAPVAPPTSSRKLDCNYDSL